MRATKIPSLKNKPYEERFKILKLPTVYSKCPVACPVVPSSFRQTRQRGDMIETYKILAGKYDNLVTPNIPILSECRTRGKSLKIVNRRCHYDLRKYSFCNRITHVWNSLTEDIVTAPSVNSFKNRLDKFWHIQELKYNWQVEITGTGNRSLVF